MIQAPTSNGCFVWEVGDASIKLTGLAAASGSGLCVDTSTGLVQEQEVVLCNG